MKFILSKPSGPIEWPTHKELTLEEASHLLGEELAARRRMSPSDMDHGFRMEMIPDMRADGVRRPTI